jgi:hypothetical protein
MNIFDKANINSILDAKLNTHEILAWRSEGNKLHLKILTGATGRKNKKKYFFDFEFDITNIGTKDLVMLLSKKISATSPEQLKEFWKKELREVKIRNLTK